MAAPLKTAERKLTSGIGWLIAKAVLEKAGITGVLILVIGLMAVLLAAVWAMWVPAPNESSGGSSSVARGLNTALIDELELWIEEVDGQRRAGLTLPDRPVFVTDDLKVEDGI